MTAEIEYQYGSYHGRVQVACKEDDENEVLFARAKKAAGLNFLPMAYESFKVISRT